MIPSEERLHELFLEFYPETNELDGRIILSRHPKAWFKCRVFKD